MWRIGCDSVERLIREFADEGAPDVEAENRLSAADRSGLRYPSDLIDAEWAIIEPVIPPAKHGGRKRTIDVRDFERHFLRAVDGLPMAGAAQGPAT